MKLDLTMKKLKPLLPNWLYNAWSAITPQIGQSAWQKTGLMRAWEPQVQSKALQLYHAGKLFDMQKQAGDHVQPTIAHNVVDEPEGELGDDHTDVSHACLENEDELRSEVAETLLQLASSST